MTRRSLAVLASLAVLPLIAGIALATPPSGVTPAVHVMGAALPDDVKVNADGVKLQTKRRAEVSVLTLTLEPGGTTGWHSHPGLALIAVSKGTGTLHAADCSTRRYRAGEAFVETGDDPPTLFRNESSSPVVLTVTFVAPRGAAIIDDEPDPGCGVR
jgi:quercetin dioxygenase-like cupin family protein